MIIKMILKGNGVENMLVIRLSGYIFFYFSDEKGKAVRRALLLVHTKIDLLRVEFQKKPALHLT